MYDLGTAFIGLMDYGDLEYRRLDLSAYQDRRGPTREDIFAEAMTSKRTGQVNPLSLY